jgi:hypothetical protein
MRTRHWAWLIVPSMSITVLRLSAHAAPPSQAPAAAATPSAQRADSVVRIERIPVKPVLLRTIKGPYSKHVEAFTEFMKFAEAKYLTVGRCFGIYPTDPDAIKGDPTWMIGVEVSVGRPGHVATVGARQLAPGETLRRLAQPKAAGYQLRELPAIEAATLSSNVAQSSSDGLRLIKWLADNGYVQVGATRMEYLSHDGPPNAIPTRIIVPVTARQRQIRPSP